MTISKPLIIIYNLLSTPALSISGIEKPFCFNAVFQWVSIRYIILADDKIIFHIHIFHAE